MAENSGYFELGRDSVEVDVYIGCLGYERRCVALVKAKSVRAAHVVVMAHTQNNVFSFDSNRKIYESLGVDIVSDRSQLYKTLKSLSSGKDNLSIGVDISSMNRVMIAHVFSCIVALGTAFKDLVIFYLPAAFEEPEKEFPKIEKIGPVSPELSGFESDPRFPIGLVTGIGHEYGLAVGLVNQIEPKLALCFRATGTDIRYEQSVKQANFDFDFGGFNIDIGEYDISDPHSALSMIESVVYGLSSSFRVIMVPLGPKFFAAISTLVAFKYFGKVAVWRVSSGLPIKDAADMMKFAVLNVNLTEFIGSAHSAKLNDIYA